MLRKFRFVQNLRALFSSWGSWMHSSLRWQRNARCENVLSQMSTLQQRLGRAAAIALIVCLTSAGCKTNDPTGKPKIASNIDQLFARWNRADSPGAAVVIVKDGK